MPYYFSPPLGPGRPYALRQDRPYSSLFRFYGGIPTGVNLWIVGGEVTTVEPDRNSVTVEHEFLGSHIYEVDDDVAALLTAAGYDLMAYSPPTPSVPLPGTDLPEWNPDLPPLPGLASRFDEAHFDSAMLG